MVNTTVVTTAIGAGDTFVNWGSGLFSDLNNTAQLGANASRLLFVGRHSYGIYIWHFPILRLKEAWLGHGSTHLLDWTYCVGYVCVAVFAGYASTRMIETYFLKLRDRYWPRMTPIAQEDAIAEPTAARRQYSSLESV